MIKKLPTLILVLFISFLNAQILAYDTTYIADVNGTCVDLSYNIPKIKGHQTNVTVTFFASQIDAQNNVNELPRFYANTSNNQVLFARVTHNTSGAFAIAQLTLNLQNTPFPSGYTSYYFCDVDADNSEEVLLTNLTTISGNIFDNNFCGITDSQTTTTFYLTNANAQAQTNPVNDPFILTGTTDIYYRVSNSVNSSVMIHYFGLGLMTCTAADDDNDGLDNAEEDVNRNGNYFDDDTDGDGLKNYQDNDDDGDNILTINEDYNTNNDPSDDDTNMNGIPDYLESSVTLSTTNQEYSAFRIYPNPVSSVLTINFKVKGERLLNVYNLNGKLILSQKLKKSTTQIDVSKFQKGIYFIKIKTHNDLQSYKFIKQ